MFVTGLAGAGKSTGLTLLSAFVMSSVRKLWLCGRTTHFSSRHTQVLLQQHLGVLQRLRQLSLAKNLSDDDRQMFEGVRILVIDEVSFLKDLELNNLMKNLQNLGDPHLPFGGYNIVFGGGLPAIKTCQC